MNKDFEIFKQFSDNTKNISIISAVGIINNYFYYDITFWY